MGSEAKVLRYSFCERFLCRSREGVCVEVLVLYFSRVERTFFFGFFGWDFFRRYNRDRSFMVEILGASCFYVIRSLELG